MTINNNILKSEDGKWLTNGEAFGMTITLGKNDHPNNWWEITKEEKEQIEKTIQGGEQP